MWCSDEIQKWLGLTPEEVKHWKFLGNKYLLWIMDKVIVDFVFKKNILYDTICIIYCTNNKYIIFFLFLEKIFRINIEQIKISQISVWEFMYNREPNRGHALYSLLPPSLSPYSFIPVSYPFFLHVFLFHSISLLSLFPLNYPTLRKSPSPLSLSPLMQFPFLIP